MQRASSERHTRSVFSATSDAAGDGEGTPGISGYMHGHYWRVPLPNDLLSLLHITAWEAVAVAVTILVAAGLAGPKTSYR